ncbi:MAG: galactokinase [bacterium]|jgi:galactokinase
MVLLDTSEHIFQERFGIKPQLVSQAPGRVEILGNHTDYNGGFVLTVAIDRAVTIYGTKTTNNQVTLYSIDKNQEISFFTDEIVKDPRAPWADYVKGVLVQLQRHDISFGGFQAVIGGNLPIGEGLSSSAALEAATALLIQAFYPFSMSKMELAILCRKAENEFVGMPCGLLDQFSVFFGENNSILFLDCDTLAYKVLPIIPPIPSIVLCQSGVKHQLVESEYKNRRKQCEAAAKTLSERLSRPIRYLREVSVQELRNLEDILPETLRKRARHVVCENQRVIHGVSALQVNDVVYLGELMRQSHESSRTLFENSCPELDILVDEASTIPGCYGSKLTGGGFGGSTVNLVEEHLVGNFVNTIQERYLKRTNRECRTIVCNMAKGALVQPVEFP